MRGYSAWLVVFLVFAVASLTGCQQKASSEHLGKTNQAAVACTGGTATLRVTPPPSTANSPIPYGTAMMVSIGVDGTTATSPTGSITLTEPSTGLSCAFALSPVSAGTSSASGDLASCKVLPIGGPYTVTATFPGDTDNPCPVSSSFDVYVGQGSTATSLSGTPPATPVYGQPFSVSATVTTASSAAAAQPSGNADLSDTGVGNANSFSTALSGGTATFSPVWRVGDHILNASYPGDNNYTGSTADQTIRFTVGYASSSVTNAAVSPNIAGVGDTVTFRATVSPVAPSVVVPHGLIHFYYYPPGSPGAAVEACYHAASATGDATCTAVVPEGKWSVIASYERNEYPSYFNPSESNAATDLTVSSLASFTLALTSSADAATTYYGTPVTFTATINTTGADPTGTVDFFRSDNPTNAFATVALTTTNGVTSATTPPVLWTGGSWTVNAVYYGDDAHQNPQTCNDITQVCVPTPGTDSHGLYIYPHETRTTFAVTVTSGSASSPVYGQTLTLKANLAVAASPAVDAKAVPPTGSIRFYDGACLQLAFIDQPRLALVDAVFPICPPLATVPLTDSGASFDIASLAIGGHDLRAVYSSDGNYATSQSTQSITIVPASTKTSVASSSNPAVVNAAITFSAAITVVPPAAVGGTDPLTPSASELEEGSVVFKDGDVTLGDATLDATQSTPTQRVYSFTTSALTIGSHSVTATYSGGTHFATSTSAPLDQVVTQDGVSATVVSSANPSTFGIDVTLTATLTATTGGMPTGTITFSEGANTLGTAPLTNGVGSIKLIAPPAGVHSILLSYGGDANHAAGPLNTFTQTVQAAPTTMTLASSVNPAKPGQSVTLTAHLTSAQSAPTGTVMFSEGAVSLGSSAIAAGDATLSTSALGVGVHVITAKYVGDTSFGPSTAQTSLTVEIGASALALATSLSPSLSGADVTFTATVTAVAPASGTPTGLVKFLRGGTAIGTVNLTAAGIASLTTKNLDVGANAITATYEGDANFAPSEGSLTQNVATSAAKIVISTTPSPSTFGQLVTITATLSGSAGTPTGSVTFQNGTAVLGSVDVAANGTATFSTSALPVGTQTLTAAYGGSATYAAGSASVAQVVGKGTTQVAVTASANPANAGDAITFDAKVTSSGGVVDGDVEVLYGTTSLGTTALVNGQASYTTNQIPAGTHTVTVKYKGNDRFEASTSTLSLVVNTGMSGTGASSSSGSPGASVPPSSNPNASGGLGIAPGNGNSSGDGCAVSNVGGDAPSSLGAAFGLALAFAAARRRRNR